MKFTFSVNDKLPCRITR
jgi:hypothetical protein